MPASLILTYKDGMTKLKRFPRLSGKKTLNRAQFVGGKTDFLKQKDFRTAQPPWALWQKALCPWRLSFPVTRAGQL